MLLCSDGPNPRISQRTLSPQTESTIVDHRVLIQENLKQNAQAPFDNTRSLPACGPFGEVFFFFFLLFCIQSSENVKKNKLKGKKKEEEQEKEEEEDQEEEESWIIQDKDLMVL